MSHTDVDPAILRAVGYVGRPERPYEDLASLRHIPGKEGLLTGLVNLWAG